MTSKVQISVINNAEKHRSVKRAVLSGISIICVGLFIAGVFFIVKAVASKFNTQIPGQVLSLPQANIAVAKPVRLKIPSLGVDAPMVNLGLNANQTLQVPKEDNEVGWYVGSPAPGVVGPSVMVGHLDSMRGPAVFRDLKKLQPGDTVEVMREDGSSAVFKVDSSQTYSQDNFPTDKVYGSLDYPGLRLITCAGKYSRLKGRYSDNLVVFASLVKT
jgi:sortase (surface protein transpeptidase)